jgi:hypothetical protein
MIVRNSIAFHISVRIAGTLVFKHLFVFASYQPDENLGERES